MKKKPVEFGYFVSQLLVYTKQSRSNEHFIGCVLICFWFLLTLFYSIRFNSLMDFDYEVKQNFYEPGMPSDLLFNNNIPAGNWDDPEENSPYAEFQDLEDYPQYYQPPC